MKTKFGLIFGLEQTVKRKREEEKRKRKKKKEEEEGGAKKGKELCMILYGNYLGTDC